MVNTPPPPQAMPAKKRGFRPAFTHVGRGLVPRKCFCDLTRDPFGGRMCRDFDPDKIYAVEPDDDQGIEQFEADGRDNEQVHSGNILRMIAQKGSPSLAWRPASLDHVFSDTRLSDLKS